MDAAEGVVSCAHDGYRRLPGQPVHRREWRFSEGGLEIRDAVEGDLPAIVAIYNATIPGGMVTADTTPVSVEARRAWFQQHTPARRPLWVVEGDAAVRAWEGFDSLHDPQRFPAWFRRILVNGCRDRPRRRGRVRWIGLDPAVAAVYLWPLGLMALGYTLLFGSLWLVRTRAEIWRRRARAHALKAAG